MEAFERISCSASSTIMQWAAAGLGAHLYRCTYPIPDGPSGDPAHRLQCRLLGRMPMLPEG